MYSLQAASTPEGQNDHKRNQLRELAALNGTLRDDENQICQNCGGVGHRKYDCPEQRNFTANIICRVCGSAGHMARDCTVNRDPNAIHASPPPMAKGGFDSEYASLMAELGEGAKGPGGDGSKNPWAGSAGHDITAGGSNIPPWRRPEVWQSSAIPANPQPNGFRPPQGYGGAYGAYPGAAPAATPGQAWSGTPGAYPPKRRLLSAVARLFRELRPVLPRPIHPAADRYPCPLTRIYALTSRSLPTSFSAPTSMTTVAVFGLQLQLFLFPLTAHTRLHIPVNSPRSYPGPSVDFHTSLADRLRTCKIPHGLAFLLVRCNS